MVIAMLFEEILCKFIKYKYRKLFHNVQRHKCKLLKVTLMDIKLEMERNH